MKENESDIGELIRLKSELENAFEIDDKDKIKELYNKFKNLYEKITGKEFSDGIDSERLTQIEAVLNDDVSPERKIDDSNEEIEL